MRGGKPGALFETSHEGLDACVLGPPWPVPGLGPEQQARQRHTGQRHCLRPIHETVLVFQPGHDLPHAFELPLTQVVADVVRSLRTRLVPGGASEQASLWAVDRLLKAQDHGFTGLGAVPGMAASQERVHGPAVVLVRKSSFPFTGPLATH